MFEEWLDNVCETLKSKSGGKTLNRLGVSVMSTMRTWHGNGMTAEEAADEWIRRAQASPLTPTQRIIRQNIRNLFLVADVKEMEDAMRQNYKDEFTKQCLQEMIDTCKAQGVNNHGQTV